MLSDPALVTLIRRFQARLGLIAQRTAFSTALTWDRLGSYDENDVDRYVELTGPALRAAKRSSALLASGFYATLGSAPPVGVDPTTVAVEPATRDPFLAYWKALGLGAVWAEARQIGRRRAEAVGSDFVTSVARRTGDDATRDQDTLGWERVLDGSSCAWCAMVADQRYRSAESADFGHDRCGCTAVPVYEGRNPGRIINSPVLDVLHKRGDDAWSTGFVNADGTTADPPE